MPTRSSPGRLLNQADVARDTAVSPATLSRQLNLLETGHVAQRLPAFFSNRAQRLVKMTRLYWTDPELPVFLARLSGPDELGESREAGSLFENLVYHHLSVLAAWRGCVGKLACPAQETRARPRLPVTRRERPLRRR